MDDRDLDFWREHGQKPVAGSSVPGMHIWGWTTPWEIEWLIEQASQMESIVEVGVLHGRSAFALLTACPGTVYCIDPFDDVDGVGYDSFMGNCGHFPNLEVVRGYSPDAGREIAGADMVFIDGDHYYDSVINDINGWLPRTRKLICGHDYYSDNEPPWGVVKAVEETFPGRVELPCGMLWAVNL